MEFFIYFLLFKNNFQLIVFMLGIISSFKVLLITKNSKLYSFFKNLFFLILGLVLSIELFRAYFYSAQEAGYVQTMFSNFLEVFNLFFVFSVIILLSKKTDYENHKKQKKSREAAVYAV